MFSNLIIPFLESLDTCPVSRLLSSAFLLLLVSSSKIIKDAISSKMDVIGGHVT